MDRLTKCHTHPDEKTNVEPHIPYAYKFPAINESKERFLDHLLQAKICLMNYQIQEVSSLSLSWSTAWLANSLFKPYLPRHLLVFLFVSLFCNNLTYLC